MVRKYQHLARASKGYPLTTNSSANFLQSRKIAGCDLRTMWRPKVAAASSRCAEAGSLRHVFGFSRWPELAAAFTCFKGHTQEKEEGALADSQDKARFLIGCIPEKRYSPRWWRPNFSKKWGTRPPSPREVNSRGSSPAVGRFAPSGLPLLFPRLIEMILNSYLNSSLSVFCDLCGLCDLRDLCGFLSFFQVI